jgi:prevent-host-death family protein
MLSIGIKELKAKLSEYVRAARAGETVLVTDRGEVVAALGPASDRVREIGRESLEARYAELERRGLVTRARSPKKGWQWRPKGLPLPPGTVERILDELRADRELP